MNLEDRKSKSNPTIATATPASKHAFEWPDDQRDLVLPANFREKRPRREHLSVWVAFWFLIWTGITVTGSLVGCAVGLFLVMLAPAAHIYGLFFGGVWAGTVGLFVIVHLGAICWTFRWLDNPLTIACIAGALTGAICGLLYLSLITVPLGIAGAYLAGDLFLNTTTGKKFLDTIRTFQSKSLGAMRFTMMDMLLRVTVLAVFIAGWSACLRSF